MSAKPLNAKRQRFVEEYLIDLNATQAAIRAGYSENSASEQAYDLLRNPQVSEAIAAAKAARSERTEITADAVVRELAKIGFSNMLDYIEPTEDGGARVDLSALDRDQAAAIQEVNVETFVERGDDENAETVKRVKFKLGDKRGALELLGKHLGIFERDNTQKAPIINLSREETDI